MNSSQIKLIRSLKRKKNRIIHNSFIVESHKNVIELLNSNYEIREVFATSEWIEKNQPNFDIVIQKANIKDLNRVSNLTNISDVLAIAKMPEIKKNLDFREINIALDGIQDPGNLGTIIRTCDWFGVKSVFCSLETVDFFNPKVIQSSMGSFTRVNVMYTDLNELIKNNSNDIKIYSTVLNAKNLDLVNIDDSYKSLIIFGNESHGVSSSLLELANNQISVKRLGKANSLNVASSCAIVLHKFCS